MAYYRKGKLGGLLKETHHLQNVELSEPADAEETILPFTNTHKITPGVH